MTLVDTPTDASTATVPDRRFAELVKRVKAEGLMERRSGAYVIRCAVTAASLAAGWLAFFIVGDSWWQLPVGVYLAFAFTQVAFLAHDAGHRQAFRSRRANDTLLLITGNLGVGIASGWWFSNHNRHHAHPNNTDCDPDVQVRYFAYSHEQSAQKRGLQKFSARFQDKTYFPMLSLLGFSLHVNSVVMVLRKKVLRPKVEGALLFTHLATYAIVLGVTLSPMKLVAFLAVHQLLFGLYLGATFAPNHKGMDMFTNETEPTFIDRQVLSSRNVRGNAVMSYLLGGLNHQIEHHLFPSMPRPNLAKARPLVRSYCQEIGLPYAEQSLFGSFKEVVAHFRSTKTH